MWKKNILTKYFLKITNCTVSFKKQTASQSQPKQESNNLHQQNKTVVEYLDSNQEHAKILINPAMPKLRVTVPRAFASLQKSKQNSSIIEKFDNQWKGKAMVFDVDPVPLLGKKRYMMKKYLQQSIYKNISEPTKLFQKNNPDIYLEIQQLKFDPSFFIITDPELANNKQNDQAEQQRVLNLYEQDPHRFGNRLFNEFNIPKQYHKLIEHAMISESPVYFCGLNSYIFRNFLTSFMTLNEVKRMFMECLNYSFFKSKDLKQLNYSSKDIIYMRNYNLFQKLQNGMIIDALQQIETDYVLFGPDYLIKSVSSSQEILKDANKWMDKSTDVQKIQKHAILEVLLGNLWNQPFTLNKYPYLSENYFDLKEQDKKTLNEFYHTNFVKYTGAAKVFYSKKLEESQKA